MQGLKPKPDPKFQPDLSIPERRLILIAGRKRTGKETLFKLLRSHFEGVSEFQFATPLKKFCIEVLGLSYEQCYGDDTQRETPTQYTWGGGGLFSISIAEKHNKRIGSVMTAREVLQVVGTDLVREGFYKNIWAEAGLRAAVVDDCLTATFTDTRFENELIAHEFFPNCFQQIITIRLYRETGLEDSHTSETALDHWDVRKNQRNISRNTDQELLEKSGYVELYREGRLSLWKHPSPGGQQFNYLLDNNASVDALESAVRLIVDDCSLQ